MLCDHVLPSKLAFIFCQGKADARKKEWKKEKKTIHARNNHDNQNTVAVRWASASTKLPQSVFCCHIPLPIHLHSWSVGANSLLPSRQIQTTARARLGVSDNPELQSHRVSLAPLRLVLQEVHLKQVHEQCSQSEAPWEEQAGGGGAWGCTSGDGVGDAGVVQLVVLRDKEHAGNDKLLQTPGVCSHRCGFLPRRGKRPLCGWTPASEPGQDRIRRGEKKSGKTVTALFDTVHLSKKSERSTDLFTSASVHLCKCQKSLLFSTEC